LTFYYGQNDDIKVKWFQALNKGDFMKTWKSVFFGMVAIIAFGFGFVACVGDNVETVSTYKKVLDAGYAYDANGNLLSMLKCEYDYKGNLKKRNIYYANGVLQRCTEFDSKGNQTKSSSYDANGVLSGYSEYEYDSKGNQTKSSSYSANGVLSYYYEYEYDSKGNQTKYSSYDENGVLSGYTVYTYKTITIML
jgi:hypothetical protein